MDLVMNPTGPSVPTVPPKRSPNVEPVAGAAGATPSASPATLTQGPPPAYAALVAVTRTAFRIG